MKPLLRPALLAILLTWMPAPDAVERSDDGFGDVLLFPYLVANASFSTLVTISANAAAGNEPAPGAIAVRVAVRFPAEAPNAPPPLLVNLLLGANDSWTFAAVPGPGPGAVIHTVDTSCAYSSAGVLDASTGTTVPRREGWIEVFELGRITSTAVLERLQRVDREQACAELAALLPTLETSNWLAAPEGSIRGTSHFVAVASGTGFTTAAVALRDFRQSPLFAAPVDDAPTLADAQPAQAVVTLDDGERRTSTFSARPVDAVSAVLMTPAWDVDFDIAAELDASTDLVATFPTRRWHLGGREVLPPFAHPDRSDGSTEINARVYDREGRRPDDALPKCTPPAPEPPALGAVVDSDVVVLAFGQHSVFSSERAQPLVYPVTSECVQGGLVPRPLSAQLSTGRLVLEFVDGPRASPESVDFGRLVSDEGHAFRGLPVIGTAMTSVVNANALPGVLASYGIEQPIFRRTDHPQDE